MNWLVRKDEATPYQNGTKIKSRYDGSIGVIEKLCNCGSGIWLHYEVRMRGMKKIVLHGEIGRLFDIVD